MALIQPTAENKFSYLALDSIVAPIDPAVAINQGSRLKLVANKVTPTTARADDWVGVADATNPVVSLLDTLNMIKVLLHGNVVWFDAPAAETMTFGDLVYAYENGGNHYSGAVTKVTAAGVKLVGTYVGLTPTVCGAGVRVQIKIRPTTVL
jgi:hypothetical protein